MDLVEVVELPIHHHPMTPVKENRMGKCCGIKFEAITDGFYCSKCDEFFHKTCSNPQKRINHHSHKCRHDLELSSDSKGKRCEICRETVEDDIIVYKCGWFCDYVIHMDCAKYSPPEVIDVPQNHNHKLKLEKLESCFTCADCGKDGDGYSYKCHECDLTFHAKCKKYAAEINHPSHSLHPLKLFNGEPPAYTDGKCRLCAKKPIDEAFYHCPLCNFTLDLHCVVSPPRLCHHDDLSMHDHQLTLVPKRVSFTCTICGLDGDRSPYVCLQCDFFAHNDCSGFPWVININRHDHRVSRTSLIGVVNSRCGVCQKKLDWSCGGYSCKRCPNSVFHIKCATREDVWDGKEMKDEPEEDEDVEPFEVIDENTIRHFLHRLHNLRLKKSRIFIEGMSCDACAYPIYHHSFYICTKYDFIIHESCANLPKRKRHMVKNTPFDLYRSDGVKKCEACGVRYNGFTYGLIHSLCMRCASVSEPFFHKSHPHHPLFYTSPIGVCSVCKKRANHVLRCVEDNCGYVMDFECALLPYEVKHRVDDHFLSLCFGEEDVSGTYWCDICERETDPKTWFYTCKDCGVTLHTDCVLGDSRGLLPGSEASTHYRQTRYFDVVRNNSMSRPICRQCKSRCIFPIIFKQYIPGTAYYCSVKCSGLLDPY